MNDRRKLILAAFFLALGLVFPFLTGQIREIGNKILPMHIPILLCGFICGWKYGFVVGFIAPLFRSMIFGMPMPVMAVGMAFELAVYGTVTGVLYEKIKKSKIAVYISLLSAMIVGRVVWGLVSLLLYGVQGKTFTWKIFVSGALMNAIPGIVLQVILIPILIMSLEKAGVMKTDEYFAQDTL